MTSDDKHNGTAGEQADEIARKAKRKKDALSRRERNELYGLGMFGLVGWAVAIPTVLGTAMGMWMDEQAHSQFSWTLAMLLAGVSIGCMNAWYWVQRESRDEDDDDED